VLRGQCALIASPQFLVAIRAGLQAPFVCGGTNELGKNSLVPIYTKFISTTGPNPTITTVPFKTGVYV
jgi:hypothetical protein